MQPIPLLSDPAIAGTYVVDWSGPRPYDRAPARSGPGWHSVWQNIWHRGMAQSGSASALGAEGRRFESVCPDQDSGSGRIVVLTAPVAQPDRAPDF